jgi:CubicO group peptidase (beta-lactamase class C family)
MSVVDQGHISLSDRVGDHLAFWTSEASDQRSGITLEHLLSFTSGLNAPGGGTAGAYDPCTLSSTMSLGVCAQAIYDNNRLSSSPPGTRFVYGRNHLVVAAAMAVEATPGVASWDELLQTQVLAPLGTDLQYLPIGNPDLLNGVSRCAIKLLTA